MKKILSALVVFAVVAMFSFPVMAEQPADPGSNGNHNGQNKDKNPNAGLNSGVGNGGEGDYPHHGEDCIYDGDPGESGGNNQAFKNDKDPYDESP